MPDRGQLPLIVAALFAALFGVYYLPSKKPPLPEKVASDKVGVTDEASTVKAVASSDDSDLLKLLVNFWGLTAEERRELPSKPDILRNRPGSKTHFLIVTIPDPVDSSVGYQFDERLFAIQRAAETADFVLERHDFPWDKGEGRLRSAGTGFTGEGTFFGLLFSAPASKESSRSQHGRPGLILFRRGKLSQPDSKQKQAKDKEQNDGNQKTDCLELLQVFLVSETPIYGIDRVALTRCLNVMAKQQIEPVFKILGPSFSGSQTSLELALNSWAKDRKKCEPEKNVGTVRILSGNASAIDQPRLQNCCARDPTIEFHAVVWKSEAELRTVLNYLATKDASRPIRAVFKKKTRIAILTESNTGFGRKVRTALTNKSNASQQRASQKPCDDSLYELLAIAFPLHISQLRQEYSKENLIGAGTMMPAVIQGGKLHVSFDKPAQPRDVLPVQSPGDVAPTAERMLHGLLSAISREKIRHVGILATDPKDTIFLARMVRDHCRDVQLFVLGSHLLYAHPEFTSALRGTLVITNYPALAENQRITYPFKGAKQRLFFPSDDCQGVYNAALALLDKDDHLLDYGQPFSEERSAPALWLSIVGQQGFFPVTVFDDRCLPQEDKDYLYRPKEPASGKPGQYESYPGLWGVLFFAVNVFLAWFALAFLLSNKDSASGDASLSTSSTFRPSSRFPIRQTCLLVLLFFSMLICAFWIDMPLTTVYFDKPVYCLSGIWGAAAFVLVAVSLVWCILRHFPLLSKHMSCTKWIVAAAVLMLLVAMLWKSPIGDMFFDDQLFLSRAVQISNGVSPVIPVLLLSLSVWCWLICHLKKIAVIEEQESLKSPFELTSTCSDSAVKNIANADTAMIDQLTVDWQDVSPLHWEAPHWRAPRQWKAIILVVLAVLFFRFHVTFRYVWTVEHYLFDWTVAILFTFLLGALVWDLAQFWALWKSIDKYLRRITLLPLGKAFDRLPLKVTNIFGPYLSAHRDRTEEQSLAQRQLESLGVAFIDGTVTDPAPDREVLIATFAQVAKAIQTEVDDEKRRQTVATLCVATLCKFWSRGAVVDSFPDKKTVGGKAAQDEKDEPRVLGPMNLRTTDFVKGEMDHAVGWLQRAEEFVAIQTIRYVSQFFLHLKNMATVFLIVPLLMGLAITSYPFQPQSFLLMVVVTLIGVIVSSTIYVFVAINKNELLSRLNNSTPNRFTLDWAFVQSVLIYAGPLIFVLLFQMGEMSDLVRSWVEPVLDIVK